MEYGNIAKVKNAMMKLDPWHFIFGTIACDDLWMWSEAGAGLGLDVVMKENVSPGLPSCARAFSSRRLCWLSALAVGSMAALLRRSTGTRAPIVRSAAAVETGRMAPPSSKATSVALALQAQMAPHPASAAHTIATFQ